MGRRTRWWTWQWSWARDTPRELQALRRRMEAAYWVGLALLFGGPLMAFATPQMPIGGMFLMASGTVTLLEAYRLRGEVQRWLRKDAVQGMERPSSP